MPARRKRAARRRLLQSFDIVGKEIFQNALSVSVRVILQLRVELRAEDGARLVRKHLHTAIFPGSEQAKALRHRAELAAMVLEAMERTAQAGEQRMLREDGLRQKAELLVPLARIDERRTEGDADELQARADAEERGRRFTDQRKLVGKGLAQTLAVPVGEAAGEKDGIRRRVERPELCI